MPIEKRERDNDTAAELVLTVVLFKDDQSSKLDGITCQSRDFPIKHRRLEDEKGLSSFEFTACCHRISAHGSRQDFNGDPSEIR